jgi:23S rRNA (uracil1939-C5)-methyltransferase
LIFKKLWYCKEVFWIEIVEDAINDAYFNAKINWYEDNVYYAVWKAEKVIFEDKILKNEVEAINTIVIDPPREWMHKDVVDFLNNLKKHLDFTLLYISCNPVTMARDIELLIKWWFRLKKLQPVDMFTNTFHIETIWLLN